MRPKNRFCHFFNDSSHRSSSFGHQKEIRVHNTLILDQSFTELTHVIFVRLPFHHQKLLGLIHLDLLWTLVVSHPHLLPFKWDLFTLRFSVLHILKVERILMRRTERLRIFQFYLFDLFFRLRKIDTSLSFFSVKGKGFRDHCIFLIFIVGRVIVKMS